MSDSTESEIKHAGRYQLSAYDEHPIRRALRWAANAAEKVGAWSLSTRIDDLRDLMARSGWRGAPLWQTEINNRIVAEGLDYQLECPLANQAAQITAWFVGLTDGTPTTAASDTLASHPGWVEVTQYTGNRQAWVPGVVSGQSVDNSASKAVFPIDTNSTVIGGAFLSEVATGAAGILYSVGAFQGGDETLNAGSTLEVTAVFTSQTV